MGQSVKEGILELRNIHKRFHLKSTFSSRGGVVKAVSGVTMSLSRGDSFGLVGESGCGKTTLGRVAIRLLRADEGRVHFDGLDITEIPERKLRPLRRRMQIIFQDPYSSLNPRMRVESIIGEGMLIHNLVDRGELKDAVAEVLGRVGLSPDAMSRYPHEFSGGQRQRVCIGRAIALKPDLIVADEPLSALDVSIQAQILNLLVEIREAMGVAYLFISHDLRVVNLLCNKVAVMYLGEIVETGDCDLIFHDPRHPYTKALIGAIPRPVPGKKGRKIVLSGDIPSPIFPPPGCSFHTRCPIAGAICEKEEPLLREVGGRLVSCHFAK
ncbi:MAG: ATP-binding cassette domain-containing protein [Deltaproteobacteria bacterium]|nr:ATP-binding cassette domain-containing protein [Deltaproteobacteria bacterium]NIS78611.1 ATP-binding cassette domain-containing protein [Deltaproteobacteria bacterium]